MSKRQQPEKSADNNRRPPMGLQCSEKIPHPEVGLSCYERKNVYSEKVLRAVNIVIVDERKLILVTALATDENKLDSLKMIMLKFGIF